MQYNLSPPPAPITHAMSCVHIQTFQVPTIDVEHPMTILKILGLSWVGISWAFNQGTTNPHDISRTSHPRLCVRLHIFWNFTIGQVREPSNWAFHLRDDLSLLATPDPCFQCNLCGLVEPRSNFFESMHYSPSMVFDQNSRLSYQSVLQGQR